ncbi:uncharacterized protein BDZ99DRAFT_481713 [Mytilinidion resinicola]|uniref:Uncharacterized protein n=1 Tax=Mytilinidion resinicola TaxID=574789 RepID=A0A6A6Y6R9_9PEZI|nr:uncharacterized protein BDZ99DRAFT_481713 [Mytilinidion resinicola]KAF2803714.1 hypothetical protein BDZ99DRAFT_481713 [Mytilinidion resinicola]
MSHFRGTIIAVGGPSTGFSDFPPPRRRHAQLRGGQSEPDTRPAFPPPPDLPHSIQLLDTARYMNSLPSRRITGGHWVTRVPTRNDRLGRARAQRRQEQNPTYLTLTLSGTAPYLCERVLARTRLGGRFLPRAVQWGAQRALSDAAAREFCVEFAAEIQKLATFCERWREKERRLEEKFKKFKKLQGEIANQLSARNAELLEQYLREQEVGGTIIVAEREKLGSFGKMMRDLREIDVFVEDDEMSELEVVATELKAEHERLENMKSDIGRIEEELFQYVDGEAGSDGLRGGSPRREVVTVSSDDDDDDNDNDGDNDGDEEEEEEDRRMVEAVDNLVQDSVD